MRGRVADVIMCFKFYRNRLRGFRAVRDQKWGSSIDFDRRPYNRSALPCCLWFRERETCDILINPRDHMLKWLSCILQVTKSNFALLHTLRKCSCLDWLRLENSLKMSRGLRLAVMYLCMCPTAQVFRRGAVILLRKYVFSLCIYRLYNTVWVKKVAPLKLFAIFSLRLGVFPWNFANLLPVHIHTCLPVLVDLTWYLTKWC